jgi:hypothetical protein
VHGRHNGFSYAVRGRRADIRYRSPAASGSGVVNPRGTVEDSHHSCGLGARTRCARRCPLLPASTCETCVVNEGPMWRGERSASRSTPGRLSSAVMSPPRTFLGLTRQGESRPITTTRCAPYPARTMSTTSPRQAGGPDGRCGDTGPHIGLRSASRGMPQQGLCCGLSLRAGRRTAAISDPNPAGNGTALSLRCCRSS